MGILADQINALDRLEEQYKREKERSIITIFL